MQSVVFDVLAVPYWEGPCLLKPVCSGPPCCLHLPPLLSQAEIAKFCGGDSIWIRGGFRTSGILSQREAEAVTALREQAHNWPAADTHITSSSASLFNFETIPHHNLEYPTYFKYHRDSFCVIWLLIELIVRRCVWKDYWRSRRR